MNIDKLETALTTKQEFFDVNNQRFLAKEFVVYYNTSWDKDMPESYNKFVRGIILKCNNISLSVLTEYNKLKSITYNRALIVTPLLKNTMIGNQLIELYNKKINTPKVYTKCLYCACINQRLNTPCIKLITIKSNSINLTPEDIKKIYDTWEFEYPNFQIYPLRADFNFYPIEEQPKIKLLNIKTDKDIFTYNMKSYFIYNINYEKDFPDASYFNINADKICEGWNKFILKHKLNFKYLLKYVKDRFIQLKTN